MNEFLEQFLIEARDLVQRATEDLLALEAAPQDRTLIDGIFRDFHTLKGAAGIVEFPAMARVMHAAEDSLAAVRDGRHAMSAALIADCLACLDQVVRWLDAIDTEGELPATSDDDAVLTAKFAPAAPAVRPGPSDWVASLVSRHPAEAARARVALRYAPDRDCFFRGEDPLDLVCRLPALLALDVTPDRPWTTTEEPDPFACELSIAALAASTPDAVAAALRPVAGQVEIQPLAEPPPTTGTGLSEDALTVLREQMLLAAETSEDGFSGRLGSAARVALNVMRRCGRYADVATLEQALDQSWHDQSAGAFAAALGAVLEPAAAPSPQSPSPDAPGPDSPDAPGPHAPGPERDETAPAATPTLRALRVDVDRIDALVTLAGELTVAKNAIGHTARLAREGNDPARVAALLKDQYALFDRLVGELQRSVLTIRVLPLHHVFQRFPRLVRDMARDLGKSVRLDTEGGETEADKATVEALFEPLLHVVRNGLDHGIEPEAERRAGGKTPAATLRLRALRDGDLVIVEVTDDGRGIDTEKIRLVAARRGLATVEALAEMSDAAAAELVFAPGFSTATAVTELSGRGVGMDAVRAAVARMGGRVSVASEPGRGTTVRFTLPFTVMIARVMTVEVSGQVFGLPIDSVIETARIPGDAISRVGAAEAMVLRGHTVPLLRLAEALELPSGNRSATDLSVVIARVAGETAAIAVDGFGDRMDVMLKPMEGLLAGMGGFAGTTLLGDGRVLIVLDLDNMAQSAELPHATHVFRSWEART